jgi:hypothetical protein
MSTTDPARSRATVRQYSEQPVTYYDEGTGWTLFAASMLAIVASLNLIDGIAAVSRSKFFVGNAQFVISDLKTWGWILIVAAALEGLVVAGIVLGWRGFRWGGVAIAGLNAVVQLLVMPAYPLWSLCLFALDILVIYALVAHGATSRS